MDRSKGKKTVISLLTLIILAAITGLWVYFRLGSEVTYSEPVIMNGLSVDLLKCLIIALEVFSGILLFIFTKSLLGTFDAFLSVIALTILPVYGISVSVYEILPALSLVLSVLAIALTIQYESGSPDSGIHVIRYVFIGITAGLAIFFLPLNLIMTAVSFLAAMFTLIFKRKSAFIKELIISIFFTAAAFVLLNTIRIYRTAVEPEEIIRDYKDNITLIPGTFYLFNAVIILVVFVLYVLIDIVCSLMAVTVRTTEKKGSEGGTEIMAADNDKVNGGLKPRPVSTGALPEDFVLHRASKTDGGIISSSDNKVPAVNPVTGSDRMHKDRENKENINSENLEFDIDIPEDDDFDIDIAFN